MGRHPEEARGRVGRGQGAEGILRHPWVQKHAGEAIAEWDWLPSFEDEASADDGADGKSGAEAVEGEGAAEL